MKNRLTMIIIFLILPVLILALAGAACAKKENPSFTLEAAVVHISTEAAELKVKSYAGGAEGTVKKGSPEYETVMTYIAKYTPDRAQPRYHEIGGKTEEIAIPYVLNYILTFNLSDGSDITFDFGYDKIWFTTKDTIYAGLVDLNMTGILEQIVSK